MLLADVVRIVENVRSLCIRISVFGHTRNMLTDQLMSYLCSTVERSRG